MKRILLQSQTISESVHLQKDLPEAIKPFEKKPEPHIAKGELGASSSEMLRSQQLDSSRSDLLQERLTGPQGNPSGLGLQWNPVFRVNDGLCDRT